VKAGVSIETNLRSMTWINDHYSMNKERM